MSPKQDLQDLLASHLHAARMKMVNAERTISDLEDNPNKDPMTQACALVEGAVELRVARGLLQELEVLSACLKPIRRRPPHAG